MAQTTDVRCYWRCKEEENPLEPIEIDPVLLMTDKQIKVEVDKLPPFQKALFEDVKKFAEDRRSRGRYL